MRSAAFVLLSGLVAAASAHFQLQFPPPRGPFVEKNEPTFCDAYPPSADANRTEFPLSGGFISLNSEHPLWTLGVELSTLQVATSFQNFTGAVPFFQVTGEGAFCFPVDFAASNITGLQDGANVTIQLIFDGGDGELFQCADLTLKSNLTLTNTTSCHNATGQSVATATGETFPTASGSAASSPSGSSSNSSSAPSASQTAASSAVTAFSASAAAGVLAFAGVLLSAF
ncbi:hypothetical protein BC629DRAFT_1438146 [Irpex lacteus]|nr:hypothetical protein BC629DRAFT_1438146 [Irpex lacteus]